MPVPLRLLLPALLVAGYLFAQDPSRARELVLEGAKHLNAGRIQEAQRDFRRALEADPRTADAHHYLGLSRLAQRRWRDAEKEFERALELDPAHPHASDWLGFVRDVRDFPVRNPVELMRGEQTGLAADLRAFVERGGSIPRAVRVLAFRLGTAQLCSMALAEVAVELVRTEAWDDAVAWLEAWEREVPPLRPTVLTYRVLVLLRNGREDEARKSYESVLESAADSRFVVMRASGEAVEHFGATLEQPAVLERTIPGYTQTAIMDGADGSVFVQGIVETDGRLSGMHVLQGVHPDLDANALASLGEWRFEPGRLGGRPVRWGVILEITFALR